MTDEQAKAQGREKAMKLLGPVFELWKEDFAEERRKGTSEDEIQARVSQVAKIVEETQRGKVPDEILDEMLSMVRELAMPPHMGPGTVQ